MRRRRHPLASARNRVAAEPAVAEPLAPVLTIAGWALWLLAGYVVAVVGIASVLVLAGLPRSAVAVLRVHPRFLRPVFAALAGLALTASPVMASAAPLHVPTGTAPPPAPPQPLTADPFDWSAPPGAAGALDAALARSGGRAPPPAPRATTPRSLAAHSVRVRAGDCLWSLAARDLAARHLGSRPAEIAVAWHRWYALNRRVIGPDPRLLHPGDVLRVPPATPPTHPSIHASRRPS